MVSPKREVKDDWAIIIEEVKNRKLSLDEKYALFNKLEVPINFAIGKVVSKFHTLPIERDDFQAIAWLAFENMLNRYWAQPTHKGFVSYLIDSVYWKCMDYACQFTNNKHKVLNFNHPEKMWVEHSKQSDDYDYDKAALLWTLEDYFKKYKIDSQTQAIFKDYLNNLTHQQICDKYQISRNRLKLIVKQTIRGFTRFINYLPQIT